LTGSPPLLLIDVDGVISLFGFDSAAPPRGQMTLIDGVPHLISDQAGKSLRALADAFECVWCTGWEERAEDHLPHLLELTGGWPHLHFAQSQGPGHTTRGHWKLDAIDAFAGPDRPLAWIDDAHDGACSRWAIGRPGPTLLVTTDAAIGLTAAHTAALTAWAEALRAVSG
jgi:hypothetical protein